MKQILILSFLLSLGSIAFCQTGKIAGTVRDAEIKLPLELATATVFGQDSSIIAYRLSDKAGIFAFDKLPLRKKILITVSYAGYITYIDTLQLGEGKQDTLSIFLKLNPADSMGVVVTATIPIRMNGDTLEINPAAFKMKNDAVVEELLNQVSGIVIWSDGSITVNGKQVQSLLVDGKPFMGSNDSRIATQNLPKSAIDKIQLYQEYDRSKIGQPEQPQDSLLTMNIKLKEGSKKGFFGKAGAGAGTISRFESDLSFQVYNKTSSIGIGGGYNNINKNIGSLQEMFSNNTFRSFNPNLYNVGRFGAGGINRNYSIGTLVMHNFIESANSRQNNRATLTYNKSRGKSYLTDLSLQNRTTLSNPQFIREEGVQNGLQSRHDLNVSYVKTNSYNDNLSLSGSINTSDDKSNSTRFTETRDSSNQLQSTNNIISEQHRKSDNEALNLNYGKSNNEQLLKNFSLQANVRRGSSNSDRDVTSIFSSLTDMSKNTYLTRRYVTNNESLSFGGNFDYTGFKRLLLGRYNLFGINLNFNQSFNYNRSSDNSTVSDYDSTNKVYTPNTSLSNSNRREITEFSPSLSLSKSITKFGEKGYHYLNLSVKLIDDFKTDNNVSSIAKRSLNRSFQFFRYEGNVNVQYNKRGLYRYFASIGYSKNFEYPSIDRLYTIVDNINAYDIRIGNPNLKNTTNHNLNFNTNFNTEEKPTSLYSFNGNINAGYLITVDPVTDSIINDFSGKRIFYYTNAGKTNSKNLNYNLNLSRRLKKSNLQLMYNGNWRNTEIPNYIDGVSNTSKTSNFSNQVTLQFSLRTVLIFTLQQSLQYSKSQPSSPMLKAFKNNNDVKKFGIVLNYPENFSFSSTIDRVSNSNVDKPIVLWNTFMTYRFMKQQGEFKFSAMDLLKKYQNITNSANAYGTVTRITNGLQQYFLLTFSYYPRKFGKTEIKRQTNSERRLR